MQELTFIVGPESAAAEVWEVIGSVGITLEASCTYPSTEGRNVRVVLRDDEVAEAKKAALAAGFGPVAQTEVLVADVVVEPGGLGRLARRVANTGAKLTTLYMATGNRVVLGADDLDTAAKAL